MIAIKGMKMPSACCFCGMEVGLVKGEVSEETICFATQHRTDGHSHTRHEKCPLVNLKSSGKSFKPDSYGVNSYVESEG